MSAFVNSIGTPIQVFNGFMSGVGIAGVIYVDIVFDENFHDLMDVSTFRMGQ